MRIFSRSLNTFFGVATALLWGLGSAPALATGIFPNTTAIDIPASGVDGPAGPYPSTIQVSGMLGTVTEVTVTLNDLSHTCPDDVIAILVGPQGDQVKLLADSGDCQDANGVTLTFDDDAATEIPSSGVLVSGTYRPETGGTLGPMCDPMPAPFPSGTLGSALSAFDGKDPNGAWSLYVCDDANVDTGSFAGGWSLRFEGATRTALESPFASSSESGIGLIRGWVCEAGRIDVIIDGTVNLELPYGTVRPDTTGVCGDANNGYGGVVSWSAFGDGLHQIRAYVDGVEFADANFFVTTLGVQYLTGAGGDFFEAGFPDASRDVTLRWSEPHQNFVFVNTIGTTTGNPTDFQGNGVDLTLESPFSGSSESGIGLIRGWACNASNISVVIDSDAAIATSYGAERPDTQSVCGDTNNGFGVVVSWNAYTSGVHRLRAYADGSPTPFADVTFNVYNLGVNHLTGIGTPSRILGDFPAVGQDVTVTWSEAHQGVVITNFTP